MKKVLAIMGSPRKSKHTNDLLDYLLDGIDKEKYEINKVYLGDLQIDYCTGCDYCGIKGECVKKDDMHILYDGFDESDIIILAAPLYFNTINGMAKNMVDRCQKYWSMKYSLGGDYKRGQNRTGLFLSVGGAPYTHDQFAGTFPIMDFFFKAINADYKGNYFISNTDKIAIADREDIKKELFEMGQNIDKLSGFIIQK